MLEGLHVIGTVSQVPDEIALGKPFLARVYPKSWLRLLLLPLLGKPLCRCHEYMPYCAPRRQRPPNLSHLSERASAKQGDDDDDDDES